MDKKTLVLGASTNPARYSYLAIERLRNHKHPVLAIGKRKGAVSDVMIETEKKITVTEIYVRLRLEQSVASQHLAILRRAGIVTTQRDGKFIYYTVNYSRIDEINRVVEDLVS